MKRNNLPGLLLIPILSGITNRKFNIAIKGAKIKDNVVAALTISEKLFLSPSYTKINSNPPRATKIGITFFRGRFFNFGRINVNEAPMALLNPSNTVKKVENIIEKAATDMI